MKIDTWSGSGLRGYWLVTRKLDGVRVHVKGNTYVSRSGKPLYGFEEVLVADGIYEVYRENWETSVSLVRTQSAKGTVRASDMYRLDVLEPTGSQCLQLMLLRDPSATLIECLMEDALKRGEEGLVLVPCDEEKNPQLQLTRYKVKPKPHVDVRITGIQPGKGKHEGRMGALLTNHGKIGTGFSDAERASFSSADIGSIVEVEIMGWTPAKKMRHPRFIRRRWDKTTENLEGYARD